MTKQDHLTIKTKILKEIFSIAPKRFQEKDLDNHVLTRKLHISGSELKKNIDFLVEVGLIQRFPGENYKQTRLFDWLITEKGLDYLEKKSVEEKQLGFNRIVAFTGAILALIGAYNFINPLVTPKYQIWITLLCLILVVGALIQIMIFIYTGAFKDDKG
jgi:DNA-binding MarR family transcriptional regulator